MGTEKAVSRRKGHGSVRTVPRLRPRRGRQPCTERGRGTDHTQDLRIVPTGTLPVCDCDGADFRGHPYARKEKDLVGIYGQGHPHEREVQRRRPSAKGLHRRFPYQEENQERRFRIAWGTLPPRRFGRRSPAGRDGTGVTRRTTGRCITRAGR